MRIGLVGRWLDLESGGAREYTHQLIQHLLRIDPVNDYVVLYNSREFVGRFPSAKEVAIPISSKLLWDYVGLPYCVRKERIDLLWTPSYVVPFPITCPSVATFLDMAYFLMPEAYERRDVYYMQRAMPGSVRRAAALLAISENTKRDMVRTFPDSESKISVTYLAPSPRYRRVSHDRTLSSVRAEYGVRQPFIFYPGSISPRKGIPMLLRALVHLRERHGLPHRLVMTGGQRWGDSRVKELLDQCPPEEILILGHVPDSVLPALYSLADLCVYPSLFEGFGLPVLEAMACGCPVVCSNFTSLPEVAGDAALLVNPRNAESLAGAMHLALTDPDTRASLIEKGLARAAMFTWEETARKTLEVFRSVGQD